MAAEVLIAESHSRREVIENPAQHGFQGQKSRPVVTEPIGKVPLRQRGCAGNGAVAVLEPVLAFGKNRASDIIVLSVADFPKVRAGTDNDPLQAVDREIDSFDSFRVQVLTFTLAIVKSVIDRFADACVVGAICVTGIAGISGIARATDHAAPGPFPAELNRCRIGGRCL